MPRQIGTSVENNFRNGVRTEASGLNFPESACTEQDNCIFNFDGSVARRPGIDFEVGYTTRQVDRSSSVINTYLWKNVSGNGDVSLFVTQIGSTIYFYKTNGATISGGALVSNIDMTAYQASGAPDVSTQECQFTAGNGYLFITHPYCDPVRVSYSATSETVSGTALVLKIRDLSGDTTDSLEVDKRPAVAYASLSAAHKYNLFNQGWNDANLTTWGKSTTLRNMPSNADVMWLFKNASDKFDLLTVPNVVRGNTPAPKGHFILSLHDQDRDTASGFTGATHTTTSYQRASTCAFFAGRVWYAGINYVGYNAKLYFTQIIERDEQYAFCYQQNDPTSEDNFDLLPSDGGYIGILDAGTIYKLVAIAGALLVFAANGVWSITGSTGLGFTATDYAVQKISSTTTISASTFVDVGGFPVWWNVDGIYSVSAQQSAGGPSIGINNLTVTTIKKLFDAIPADAKLTARGFYNRLTGEVQWLYRAASSTSPIQTYTYDSILIYQTRTEAFYSWSISPGQVAVNGLVVLEVEAGQLSVSQVVDQNGINVVDGIGNLVATFERQNSSFLPTFLYLVSYPTGSTYNFTMAQAYDTGFTDWHTIGDDVDYTSYFISGYKLHGGALRKFQTNYIRLYSLVDENVEYSFQSLWDYSTSGDTGRWSQKQIVSIPTDNYSYRSRRLKTRGSGLALQFKVTSKPGKYFNLTGWSTMESANAAP